MTDHLCSSVFIIHDGTGRLHYGLETDSGRGGRVLTEVEAVAYEQGRRPQWRHACALDDLRRQSVGLPVILSTDRRRFAWAFDELPIVELSPEEFPGAETQAVPS